MLQRMFIYFCMAMMLVPALTMGTVVHAEDQLIGQIIQGSGSTLYYVGADGKRYVFPNEKTFKSWFDDFLVVEQVRDQQLAQLPLAGNVRYRPGALLVKIQTDPRVYAVSQNGVLRWITTESLARKFYGDQWNLLVDDVPDAFFVNYTVGNSIASTTDYDPEAEEDTNPTIGDDLGFRHIRQIAHAQARQMQECQWLNRAVWRLQKRIAHLGLEIGAIGTDLLEQCVAAVNDSGNAHEKKVTICHIPPGDTEDSRTLTVGKSAAAAHLTHGDTVGACTHDGDQDDTAAPVISGIGYSASSTSARITWITNENSKSVVRYAQSHLASATTTLEVHDGTPVQAHSVNLYGLVPSTTYYFIVASSDGSGNMATSAEHALTTGVGADDTTPPVISAVSSDVATSTAVITWTTNENSTSSVTFADESLATATSNSVVNNASMVTFHAITLSGLTPATTYYYKVTAVDGHGTSATSTQYSFATDMLADVTPPVVSTLTATPSTTTAQILWTTNESSTSRVVYALESLTTATSTETVQNVMLVTSHSINLTGLTASTTYYFIVQSADVSGNSATSTEDTFVTE
ncbi:MAG: hypothetical protein COT39_04070 [Parcubacteria group bacterium CG08_land_8_20_14_0_20_48_21]|nr:MAG: hypothetical protein COT39_04070 [Parcubacteria group bacterium CG08_land_8_20_14_0_20_48_21]PIW79486.1 MAG: hypothetical protein COZ99_00830 [Parcubacteria group bacterium CG_4_8_14_3_um_filter_48_16]PIY77917.1 MAG: hypothetical protein COY83_02585 [Parcubacteria group bacterium CG_4_10_14_0_8_um_filter_48_154]PIZ77778.1 MAG: hypothetical protein COY03_01620 [bacterium CG_4_10_14_0_2_um_filter_48_144]PJC39617.1 MAG: hypothetical protein CO043_03320 [Parcubacteria group bacterium CG_4_9